MIVFSTYTLALSFSPRPLRSSRAASSRGLVVCVGVTLFGMVGRDLIRCRKIQKRSLQIRLDGALFVNSKSLAICVAHLRRLSSVGDREGAIRRPGTVHAVPLCKVLQRPRFRSPNRIRGCPTRKRNRPVAASYPPRPQNRPWMKNTKTLLKAVELGTGAPRQKAGRLKPCDKRLGQDRAARGGMRSV